MRKGCGRVVFSVFPASRAALFSTLAACLLFALAPGAAHGDDGWERRILSLTWDNDATYGTDRHYTHGAQISYYSADDALPRLMRSVADILPAFGFEPAARKWGLNVGQQIFTPGDLHTSRLVEDDRPYAAWLFAGLKLQRRGPASFGWPVMETLRLEAGVVGPEALGRESQRIVHLNAPNGWDNQLRTEAGGMLQYERRYLYRERLGDGDWQVDFVPYASVAAGNIAAFASAGSALRIGLNIPNEFAASHDPGPLRGGAYFFMGLEGRAVARNIFLDGNTFRDSHRVDKKPLVGDFRAGLTFVLKKLEITVAQTFRSREFEGQKHNDSFGTLMLVVKF